MLIYIPVSQTAANSMIVPRGSMTMRTSSEDRRFLAIVLNSDEIAMVADDIVAVRHHHMINLKAHIVSTASTILNPAENSNYLSSFFLLSTGSFFIQIHRFST